VKALPNPTKTKVLLMLLEGETRRSELCLCDYIGPLFKTLSVLCRFCFCCSALCLILLIFALFRVILRPKSKPGGALLARYKHCRLWACLCHACCDLV
jgi:hypothetical protein